MGLAGVTDRGSCLPLSQCKRKLFNPNLIPIALNSLLQPQPQTPQTVPYCVPQIQQQWVSLSSAAASLEKCHIVERFSGCSRVVEYVGACQKAGPSISTAILPFSTRHFRNPCTVLRQSSSTSWNPTKRTVNRRLLLRRVLLPVFGQCKGIFQLSSPEGCYGFARVSTSMEEDGAPQGDEWDKLFFDSLAYIHNPITSY